MLKGSLTGHRGTEFLVLPLLAQVCPPLCMEYAFVMVVFIQRLLMLLIPEIPKEVSWNTVV